MRPARGSGWTRLRARLRLSTSGDTTPGAAHLTLDKPIQLTIEPTNRFIHPSTEPSNRLNHLSVELFNRLIDLSVEPFSRLIDLSVETFNRLIQLAFEPFDRLIQLSVKTLVRGGQRLVVRRHLCLEPFEPGLHSLFETVGSEFDVLAQLDEVLGHFVEALVDGLT